MKTWKKLLKYDNNYEVNEDGVIRKIRGESTIQIIKPVEGYGMRRVCLKKDGKYKLIFVAEIVLTAFRGPKPEGKKAVCKDGNFDNLCISNLSWEPKKKRKYQQTTKKKKATNYGEKEWHSPNWYKYHKTRSCKICVHRRNCLWTADAQLDYAKEGCQRYKRETHSHSNS